MQGKKFAITMLVMALAQSAVWAAMIGKHRSDLQRGTEILVKSTAYDPRDLFKGFYARLGLAGGQLTQSQVDVELSNYQRRPAFALLKQGEGSFWQIDRVVTERPSTGLYLSGLLVQQGENASPAYRMEFPFQRYYASQTRAQELERLNANSQLGLILSVLPDGSAKIKGLMVDGERVLDERLW